MKPIRRFGALAAALLSLISLCGCGGGSSDPARFSDDVVQRLDSAIATRMQQDNLPGVVVGIWVPGRGEYVVARGTANRGTGRAREPGDPFRIASITKTFTATAILQLVDEGKLSVTDKVSKWYPDFPNAERITVDDLLRMRSGIPDSADRGFLEFYYAHPDNDITAEEMIRRSGARASEFEPPNQKTVYANVNFYLLQEIVQKVSGQDFGTRITQRILQPLGMTNSLYPTGNTLPGELRGYGWNARSGTFEDKTVLNPAPAGGAGALISTLWDLRTFAKALYTGALLKTETQRTRLQTPALAGDPDIGRYGQGIVKLGKFWGHNGTIFGFSSEMWYLPEKDAVIVINVNRLDADDQSKSSALFLELSKIVFPEDVNW